MRRRSPHIAAVQGSRARVSAGLRYSSPLLPREDRKWATLRKIRIDHRNPRDHEVAAHAAFDLEVRNAENGVASDFRTAPRCCRNGNERQRGTMERPAASDSFEKIQRFTAIRDEC